MDKNFVITKEELVTSTYSVSAKSREEALELIEQRGEDFLTRSSSKETKEDVWEKGYLEDSEILEYILDYSTTEEAEVDEDEQASTPIEKFEKAIGYRLGGSMREEFPFNKRPTEKQLKEWLADECRKRLSVIGKLNEFETDQYEQPKDIWTNGRHLVNFNHKAVVYHKARNRETYDCSSVFNFNTSRYDSADDAVIGLFRNLTGLSKHWEDHHIVLFDGGAPIKHFRYNWNTHAFNEHEMVNFERMETGEYQIAQA